MADHLKSSFRNEETDFSDVPKMIKTVLNQMFGVMLEQTSDCQTGNPKFLNLIYQ